MKYIKSKIAIAFLILLMVAPVVAQEKEDTKVKVKVLSFNILGGRTTKGDFNLDALAKLITDADPDFVAMQEVDYKVNRSKKYDLATELGWRTKMAPIFARAMYYDGGEYGEGVLSKYSFLSTRNVPLPYKEGQEPRAALEVVVELPSKDTIAFVGTHFAHETNEGRQVQAEKINQVFSKNKYPTILAGDLNAVPGSGPINTMEEIWQTTYNKENPEATHPSDNPRVKIDYVMFHPKNHWRVLEKKIIADTYASDHCAYLVTLELIQE
ncbi:endonuclease/exonuclease/phosphatase family protein [Flagellimonas onchidii]|uniref:endonuclease/exonuclease/phosphatase family protein n=1 Tax=Flagellimonas onchidii TaxID=2562684 RepID=UPI00145614BB|nr:endonuclease/exonuclease/phosphatase family protein [Allomuricauda onchidii]